MMTMAFPDRDALGSLHNSTARLQVYEHCYNEEQQRQHTLTFTLRVIDLAPSVWDYSH